MYGELPEIETSDGGKLTGFLVPLLNSPTGPKQAVLRLPTPDELTAYMNSQRTVTRRGTFNESAAESATFKSDLDLFSKLCLWRSHESDDTWAWDAHEASYAINLITLQDIKGCERVGETFVVTLATLFGSTTHTLRIPWQSELFVYRRDLVKSRLLSNGGREEWLDPEAPGRLYDATATNIQGYLIDASVDLSSGGVQVQRTGRTVREVAALVPPHHKRSVVQAVVMAVVGLDPVIDPNL